VQDKKSVLCSELSVLCYNSTEHYAEKTSAKRCNVALP